MGKEGGRAETAIKKTFINICKDDDQVPLQIYKTPEHNRACAITPLHLLFFFLIPVYYEIKLMTLTYY